MRGKVKSIDISKSEAHQKSVYQFSSKSLHIKDTNQKHHQKHYCQEQQIIDSRISNVKLSA